MSLSPPRNGRYSLALGRRSHQSVDGDGYRSLGKPRGIAKQVKTLADNAPPGCQVSDSEGERISVAQRAAVFSTGGRKPICVTCSGPTHRMLLACSPALVFT